MFKICWPKTAAYPIAAAEPVEPVPSGRRAWTLECTCIIVICYQSITLISAEWDFFFVLFFCAVGHASLTARIAQCEHPRPWPSRYATRESKVLLLFFFFLREKSVCYLLTFQTHLRRAASSPHCIHLRPSEATARHRARKKDCALKFIMSTVHDVIKS